MWNVLYWSAWMEKRSFGYPQMRFQIRRKLIQVLEEARKRTPVDSQHGVVRIHDVKPNGSVIHVHNDLYGISNVVQPFLKGRRVGIGVGKVIRDGVGILDPVQLAPRSPRGRDPGRGVRTERSAPRALERTSQI